MDYREIDQYLGPALLIHGFTVDEICERTEYRGSPACAVFFRASDCKFQVCWSAREGSVDFMLSRLEAPNEFGLINKSKEWKFLLMLDSADDDLVTPSIQSDVQAWWRWRMARFDAHIEGARRALLRP